MLIKKQKKITGTSSSGFALTSGVFWALAVLAVSFSVSTLYFSQQFNPENLNTNLSIDQIPRTNPPQPSLAPREGAGGQSSLESRAGAEDFSNSQEEDSSNASSEENDFSSNTAATNLAGIQIESDPIFTLWNKQDDIKIKESQIKDLQSYLTDISGLNISSLTNDSNYLTSYIESDPIFSASEAFNFTQGDKTKLDGLNNYTLPIATADTFGGIKIGARLSITNGILSADIQSGSGLVDSVNGQTGIVTLDPDDFDDTSTAHKFVSATQISNWNTAYSWGNHSGLYLALTGTATNSNLLENHSASYFQTALGFTPYNSTNPAGYITDGNTNWDNSYGFLTSYTETDPVFLAWDKSTGISITESQISNLQSYLTTETDPVFLSSQAHNITASHLTILGNTSNTNTGDETQSSIQTKLGTATTTTSGYLTSTDWNTFNSKQPAGSYLTSISGLNISDLTNDSSYIIDGNSGWDNSYGFITNLSAFTTDNLTQGTTNLYSQWETSGSNISFSGGNVGIGTTNPTYALDVAGSVAFGTGAEVMRINNGNVGIGTIAPTAQLHTSGTVRFQNFGASSLGTDADGNLIAGSDERLKNISSQFTTGLSAIMNINPINYYWKDETGFDIKNQYTGFSAQNIQANIPQAVGIDARGYLTLSDRPILATVVNATKEQQAQIISITNNQNKIVDQLTGMLTDQNLSVDNKLQLIGSSLDSLATKEIQKIKDQIIADKNNITVLQNQMTDIQTNLYLERYDTLWSFYQSFELGKVPLKNALENVFDGGIIANDIEVLNTIKAKDIEAIDGLKGKNIELSSDVSGTSKIKAGELESEKIITVEAKTDIKIYITPKGSTQGKVLFYDETSVDSGVGFKVKIDAPTLNEDIEFNWLIVK